MEFLIYSIYDRVSGLYAEPFYATKEELAVRKFDYFMSNSPMVALDCELYLLGSYNSETGYLVSYEKPIFVKRYEVKGE